MRIWKTFAGKPDLHKLIPFIRQRCRCYSLGICVPLLIKYVFNELI